MARFTLILTLLAFVAAPGSATGEASDSTVVSTSDSSASPEVVPEVDSDTGGTPVTNPVAEPAPVGLSYLVPELEGAGYRVSAGQRQFFRRLSFSPGIGQLGSEDLYAFRVAYNPNSWLGYEINLAHNPAFSLHAMMHTFNVVLRYPLPWRAQPYIIGGYGMYTVFPGNAINADPVTKNTLTGGGGLELYIRDDVALRGEIRGASVFGQELGSEATVIYSYREYTIGFAFYRNLGG